MRRLLNVLCLLTALSPVLSFSHRIIDELPLAERLMPSAGRLPGSGLALMQTDSIEGAKMPRFAADPSWPQLPEGHLIGQVSGVSVD